MSEIRFPTLDTGPMSEEQKQMIANMSELRDGKYSVMVEQKDAQGFKTGIMKEKAITELSEEDIKTLSESSKPKQLEDIAKEQLTALNRIANAVTSTATAPKAGLFGSAGGQGVRRAGYNIESGAADKAGELIKPGEVRDLANKMLGDFKTFAQQMASGDKKGAEKTGKKIQATLGGVNDEAMKRLMGLVGDTVQLTKEQIEMFTHVGNQPSSNTIQTTSEKKPQTQQQTQAPKIVASTITTKDMDELGKNIKPDYDKLKKHIGGGGDQIEINKTLSELGTKIGESGMDEKSMKTFMDTLNSKTTITDDQIKSITDATNVTEKNTIQQPQTQQTQSQTQEPKSAISTIAPKDIEELANKMSPDFNKLYEQIGSGGGNEEEVSVKLSKIGERLGKSGTDENSIKEITDMLGKNAELSQTQIKTLTDATKVTDKNETQQPQISQQQTQEPKTVVSGIKPKDIEELAKNIKPDYNNLKKQIGGDQTEINDTLSELGTKIGDKLGGNDERIKMFTDMVVDNSKLNQDQIKTLTDASNVTEKNIIQQPQTQQPQSQTQEPKSVGLSIMSKDIEELANKMSPDFNKLYEQIGSGGDNTDINETLSGIGEKLGKSGMDENAMKILTDKMVDNSKLSPEQIKSITDATKVTEKNETQKPQIAQQTQTQEPKTVVSEMTDKQMDELAKNIKPDYSNLKKQIGGDDAEINATLLKIGDRLGESGMDNKTIEMLTNKMGVDAKLSESQIKTLINATKVTEKNETQQLQTTDQSKEQTGIANMIKPEEIKGLVEKMLPDFKNFAQQMESGNEVDAEKTGKDIELQLSKFGMDDKTMKMFTDMVSDSTTLTGEQIKTLAKSSQVTEKNETQQPQMAQQPQTQSQTEGPKLSWMKQIDAFDKVTQGVAGETQTVNNSQVNDLNNQTVTSTNNNQQQQTNQSDYLIDRISQAQAQTQIVEHKFEGTITIKVDAPPGVNAAYVTKTINDMVNSPDFTNKIMKDQKIMANNYGLTGGKVSEYTNSSSAGFSV